MKPSSRQLVLLACVAAGLSACASHGKTAYQAPAPTTVQAVDQDSAYISQVEAIAKRRNIGVTWINPPTRRHKLPRSE